MALFLHRVVTVCSRALMVTSLPPPLHASQRIRDEILDIQRANNCMGGFMEQWHQKLHNNTTPDDVPICQASECRVGG